MTPADADSTLSSYASRLEAEIGLLRELGEVSRQQHAAIESGDTALLPSALEARDRIMAAFVAVDAEAAPLLATLSADEALVRTRPGFPAVASLRETRTALIREILDRDHETIDAARAANLARQELLRSLEAGGTTLSAYRRAAGGRASTAVVVSQRA